MTDLLCWRLQRIQLFSWKMTMHSGKQQQQQQHRWDLVVQLKYHVFLLHRAWACVTIKANKGVFSFIFIRSHSKCQKQLKGLISLETWWIMNVKRMPWFGTYVVRLTIYSGKLKRALHFERKPQLESFCILKNHLLYFQYQIIRCTSEHLKCQVSDKQDFILTTINTHFGVERK